MLLETRVISFREPQPLLAALLAALGSLFATHPSLQSAPHPSPHPTCQGFPAGSAGALLVLHHSHGSLQAFPERVGGKTAPNFCVQISSQLLLGLLQPPSSSPS